MLLVKKSAVTARNISICTVPDMKERRMKGGLERALWIFLAFPYLEITCINLKQLEVSRQKDDS